MNSSFFCPSNIYKPIHHSSQNHCSSIGYKISYKVNSFHLKYKCSDVAVHFVNLQTGLGQDQVPHMLNLMLAPTVLVIIKLTKFAVALRLRCGCVAVPLNWFFDIISSFVVTFKNIVHSLEPSETPSYSASHLAPNYVQHS